MLVSLLLYAITAFFEILGCYSILQLSQKQQPLLFGLLAVLSLALFGYLLTLHDSSPGRVYAAYGGVYVLVSLFWLWLVDHVSPSVTDLIGVTLTLGGAMVIILGELRH
ncbi:YnfA family protein [Brackiella oedipodis]|uniref:YnfA family protein n=1 Tax=Brackiella oedipodis TaxID=124225 RepID=UPI00056DDF68|nr:YnfA family protein [Brackiella oedipodis]